VLALSPNTVPAATPIKPSTPAPIPTARCAPPYLAGSDAAVAPEREGETSSPSGGTFTVMRDAAGPTSTATDHLRLPAAAASIVCEPGSTGIGVPRTAGSRGDPSREMTTPAAG